LYQSAVVSNAEHIIIRTLSKFYTHISLQKLKEYLNFNGSLVQCANKVLQISKSNRLRLEVDLSSKSVKIFPTLNVFSSLTSSLRDFSKSIVSVQNAKRLQEAKQTHSSNFRAEWNAAKALYQKKKKFMKDYVNTLKEKDQKMEDSHVQRHVNIEEQLKLKNTEIISQNKKERKKKELEE